MKTKILSKFTCFSILCFAMLAACLMSSQSVSAEISTTTIAVSGSGSIKATPDIAYLNAGVRTSGTNVDEASKQNIELTKKIVETLTKMGINEKDIKTQYFYVSPSYDYSTPGGQNKIIGYEVNNSLNITIRNIDTVSEIIDACIASGANTINGLSYGIETPSNYYGELFRKSVADAQKKASSIAETLSMTLSAPISVTESGAANVYPVNRNASIEMAMDAGAGKQMSATFTAPGEIELTSSITILYGIK